MAAYCIWQASIAQTLTHARAEREREREIEQYGLPHFHQEVE
jgi:hypothetical protein